jgi:prolyl-tRNA synthetase
VILPVMPKPEHEGPILEACAKLAAELSSQTFHGDAVRVEVDQRDLGGGVKNWEWIKKGVPIRIEIGPRDLESGSVALTRRDQSPKEKQFLPSTDAVAAISTILQEIQDSLLSRAVAFRDANLVEITAMEEFRKFFTPLNKEQPEIHGGFALVHWAGSSEDEEALKQEMRITVRCIPKDAAMRGGPGTCILTGKPAEGRVIFAKSY